jgi:site-specific recombinase XerD
MKNQNGKKLPEILTEEEALRLQECVNKQSPSRIRDSALIVFLLNTGLRISEATGLRVKDVDFETGEFKIKEGKGGFERINYLNPKVLAKLLYWREHEQSEIMHKSEFLFPNLKGNRLSVLQFQVALKKIARKVGIEKNVYPHLLRHTAGSYFYRREFDIRATQEFLGHKSISSTQIYTKISPKDLKEKVQRFEI